MTLPYRYYILLISLFIISCTGQVQKGDNDANTKAIQIVQEDLKIPLPAHGFYCGFLDHKGNLWFGSRGNGVFRFDGKSFTNFTTVDGLCDNDISCISEDRKGNLWFGTSNGVCKYDGIAFESLEIPKSDTSGVWLDKVYPVVNPNQVMSILEDEKGNLWFGTNGAGVYHYDGQSFTQYLSEIGKFYEDGQQHNIVLSIVEDLKGNIWFTSLSHGGVSVFDGKEFKHYIDELSDDFIRIVHCDSQGNILIGTHGIRKGGLDLFDGLSFKSFYKTNDGFKHNNIRWIYEDRNKQFWLGSGITELTIFDGHHFKAFKDKQGNTFDKIIFVIGDRQDNIWFGNKNGLWKYDHNEVVKMTQA